MNAPQPAEPSPDPRGTVRDVALLFSGGGVAGLVSARVRRYGCFCSLKSV